MRRHMIAKIHFNENPVKAAYNRHTLQNFFQSNANKKLEWNEEIDMDPDSFYLRFVNKSFKEYASDKQFLRYSH